VEMSSQYQQQILKDVDRRAHNRSLKRFYTRFGKV
jgi:hypothetical protein